MSDENNPKELGTVRPTGKRQLSGSSTISTEPATAKRAQVQRSGETDDSPSGGVAAFPGEVVSEIRKVIWPTGREMVIYTTVVFAFLIVLTVLVWGVDQLASLGVEAALIP